MIHEPTDEDLQIARLIIHRDLIGWIMQSLSQVEIPTERTKGNNVNGDIRLMRVEDVVAAKTRLRQISEELQGKAYDLSAQPSEALYIEIKAYSGITITSGLARQLIAKGCILGIVTTTIITQPAKALFNQADIAWIERFPENLLRSTSISE
jgi:hypothetical protein